MSYGKRSMAVLGTLVVSLLLILGGFLAVALHARLWIPALAVGLILNLGLMLFLWQSMNLLAQRCAAPPATDPMPWAALDAADDGLLFVDGAGRILDHNPSFLRLWDLTESALKAGDDARVMDHILAQVKDPDGFLAGRDRPAGAATDTLDLWDGRVFERRSAPVGLREGGEGRVWRFRDVTARAKADLFVHRLAQAVEQSPTSIVITDTAGSLEFVNPQFTRLTGYSLEEALGQNLRILKSGLTPMSVFEDLWATITDGRVWVGELQNRKKNGELFWERATISPLRDSDHVITHYLGLKEDITPQKQLEHQLRHAQKLEAVGLLAGGVAHDFNNILQVINGYGSLMQMAQAPDDPHRKSLGEILNAAERAAQLTHSLLAFSRKQVMNARTLDLNGLVANVEKFLRRIIGEDVRLQVKVADAPLQVHVDLGHMEQVLLNLATNARDAMPKGGALTITTGPFRMDEEFRGYHGYGRPGDYALLQVQDSGEGMSEDTLKRIFDPFFTTKEMGRGTGLGLSLVYGTIKQLGGYILVDSAEGQGTTFRIYLPIATSAPSEEGGRALENAPMKGTETILVAEDEPAVRGVVELVLKNYGYAVLLAEDGQAAVETFLAHRDEVGLVLMDIIMPRKSGRQASEEILQACPGAKILFTSGYTADFINRRGELGQGMELIMKPVQPLALLRKVREILDRP